MIVTGQVEAIGNTLTVGAGGELKLKAYPAPVPPRC